MTLADQKSGLGAQDRQGPICLISANFGRQTMVPSLIVARSYTIKGPVPG